MKNISSDMIASRFKFCDSKFYPYLEEVLKRMPNDICFREVIEDNNLEIVSIGKKVAGQYFIFPNEIKHLIFLNENILHGLPEFHKIHTIAHEIAHKIAGVAETKLNEKEAEELLLRWGFHEEVEKVDYYRPIVESAGSKIGYNWAKKQDDLSNFDEYFNAWNNGTLSDEIFAELLYDLDIHSIVAEETTFERSEIPDELNSGKSYPGDTHFDKGIIYGVMKYIKETKKV